jgi:hypothetical protein
MGVKVLILDLYKKSKYRISKDTSGGYGTENDFGIGFLPQTLAIFAKKMLFWPPLSILNFASELINAGIECGYSQNIKDIDNSLDYIFINVSIICSSYELSITREIKKKYPKIKIFATGSFAKIMEQAYRAIDVAVIVGEPEFISQQIKINNVNLNFLHSMGTIKINGDDPNKLSLPLWINLKSCKTKNYIFGLSNGYAPIIATYGCPYSCYEYCVYPLQQGRKIRNKDPEKVIEEILYIQKKSGIKNYVFRDPVFSINKSNSSELLEKMAQEVHGCNFTIETHLNNIDQELAIKFKDASINWIKFGIESSSMTIKKNVHRYTLDNDDQITRVNILKKEKIKTVAMYILCQPNDSYETCDETIQYSIKLGTDLAQFSIFTPYPGTPHFSKMQADKNLLFEDWEKYTQYNLVYKHDFFDINAARKILGKAYTKYYINKIKKKFYIS